MITDAKIKSKRKFQKTSKNFFLFFRRVMGKKRLEKSALRL